MNTFYSDSVRDTLEAKFGREGFWSWRPLNYNYLRFVVPTPD